MNLDILLSGFGGQGLMSLGKFIAHLALEENRYTLWFPSYGAEVRGGTAHCFVKIYDEPILSPLIEKADISIILNQQSLDKFGKKIKKGGFLILNSNLVERKPANKNIEILSLPLNEIALTCGNIKVANVIALGVLFEKIKFFKEETVIRLLKQTFNDKLLLKQNLEAFRKGRELLK
ncbi:MAG: 2-oxoacid:acceptor oxidoreductase family protein [Candidatus Omnitrophica bacterium]|nr:2-oxoacid:acceptor oxidoreductase family protein [Candidatus Omnitrophota bacterium]